MKIPPKKDSNSIETKCLNKETKTIQHNILHNRETKPLKTLHNIIENRQTKELEFMLSFIQKAQK